MSSSSSSSTSSSSVLSTTSSSSSTSTSSSSSIDSSSSSLSSSSSSLAYSSSSSSSHLSNSSSSSIDSSSSSSSSHSSSSSESIGNTSSSSSSSLRIWNQSKPLILANSAIANISVQNRLSQAIRLTTTTYDIGKVYCYLYSSNSIHSFNIYLAVFESNDDGSPETNIKTVSIDASTITSDGWYAFEFNLAGSTPISKLISFVMWQDGGSEDNYVMWGYSVDTAATYAWFTSDNSDWFNQVGITRSLRVVGTANMFDLVNFQVNSPPAQENELISENNSNGASYFHTIALFEPSRIELDQPDLVVSFVVDASGSMGWNNRDNNRTEFISGIVNRFLDHYPSNVVFDVVKFGSLIADPQSITSQMGQVMSINLDINTPTRTTYIFHVKDKIFRIYKNATYSHNDHTYTPFDDYDGANPVVLIGDGIPLSSGTLTRISGVGDDSIVFDSFTSVNAKDNSFVAVGFKNFESGHVYNLGGINIDDITLVGTDSNLWQLLYSSPESPTISIGSNGPRNDDSTDIYATESLVARNIFGTSYSFANVTSSISKGDVIVNVSNAAEFGIGSRIDLVDRNYLSANHAISAIDGNEITFGPSSTHNIGNESIQGGMINNTSYLNQILLSGLTVQIYLRDTSVSRNITFYLQTIDGYLVEWDIKAHDQWYINNIYWLEETALLPITVNDKYGAPFPNGTRIDLTIGMDETINNEATFQLLTKIANIGEYTVYVESLEGFSKDQSATLIDDWGYKHLQVLTITELGVTSDSEYYVTFSLPLIYTFEPSQGAKLVAGSAIPIKNTDNSPVSVSLSMVDVTPIYTQKVLDPSLREPYDPDPVPINTPYSSLNNAAAYIKDGTFNVPSIDGNGVVRILPITEDILKTQKEKENVRSNLLRLEPEEKFIGQEEEATGDLENTEITIGSTTEVVGTDYVIETPIYLYNGEAESAMTTTAIDLSVKTFEGLSIPGISEGTSFIDENGLAIYDMPLYVKGYSIVPYINKVSKTGVSVAKQYFDDFQVWFAMPYNIWSMRDVTKIVPYWVPYFDESLFEYIQTNLYGVYASDENGSYTIDYVVTNKFQLQPSAKLNIHVYSNKIVMSNMEAAAYKGFVTSKTFLNVKYPDIIKDVDGTATTITRLSAIDAWRQQVESNSSDPNSIEASLSEIEQTNKDLAECDIYYRYLNELSDPNTPKVVDFYTKPNEWTNATQYEIYETTIDVVDGRATFVLPSSLTPAMIFVEASVEFAGASGSFESIRGDFIIVSNPITVGPIHPLVIPPKDNKTDELLSEIKWMDGSNEIEDNVQFDFVARTQIYPSTSRTENGIIRGVYIGPHAPFITPSGKIYECIIVKTKYMGYSLTTKRLIEWSGLEQPDWDKPFPFGEPFSFWTTATDGYADGSIDSAPAATVDLFDETNMKILTDDIRKRLLGYEQKNNENCLWESNIIRKGGENYLGTTPSSNRWTSDGTLYFRAIPLNQNVGRNYLLSSPPPDYFLDYVVNIATSYYVDNEHAYNGFGFDHYEPNAIGNLEPAAPIISYLDPLDITIEIEEYNNIFIRNGTSYANVVATVTWKEEAITKDTFEYPLPLVTFTSGEFENVNTVEISPTSSIPKDNRGPIGCCLKPTPNRDATLISYVIQSGLIRTDIYEEKDINNNIISRHTHECIVNDNGDGTASGLIILKGTFADHTHIITNYQSDIIITHSHKVRCVAITQLNPTSNNELVIAVNGYAVYDPTNCLPHTYGSNPSYFPTLPSGNRIMFNSAISLGYAIQSKLDLTIWTGIDLHLYDDAAINIYGTDTNGLFPLPPYFTAETPNDTEKGFDVRALAKFTSYMYEDPPGTLNAVPERIVSDGSRITFEIIPYKSEESSEVSIDTSFVSTDVIKKYMVLAFKSSIASEGQFASREFSIPINSNLQYISGIQSLMPELSNDISYVTTALTKIDSIGGSQLHDAVKEASQRIIQEQTDTPAYKNYEKVIFLVTDGDENSSEYSLQQAVNGMNFINGSKETPSIGIQLGKSDSTDVVIMQKYAEKTSGEVYPFTNLSSSDIVSLIDFILKTSTSGFNYGTYKNLLSFDQASIPIEFRLGYVYLPSNTSMNYRIRYTVDGEEWSTWSEWSKYNIITSFTDTKIIQFQYEVQFFGNENFEHPVLYGLSDGTLGDSTRSGNIDNNVLPDPIENGDITTLGKVTGPPILYNHPQSFTIFFKPISINTTDFEYLSAIHITQEADIPETSTIEYGIVQSGDLELEEYMINSKYINSDTYTILLTRYNESLTTTNFKTYYTLNGRWPHSCSIEIYRFNAQNPDGILVNSSEYAENSINGQINFFNYQNTSDTFTINVIFKPFFRLIAKINNYGPKSSTIHHIGVVYNTCKRVPTQSNGNIIHKPINNRVK